MNFYETSDIREQATKKLPESAKIIKKGKE